jgi:hypothetical protein
MPEASGERRRDVGRRVRRAVRSIGRATIDGGLARLLGIKPRRRKRKKGRGHGCLGRVKQTSYTASPEGGGKDPERHAWLVEAS